MTDINSHAKKPNGLVNQGATCYLNSVLQVLFMTKDFKEAVTRDSKYIDPLLKHLFETLKKKTATTSRITKKLKIQVYEQRDAAEYFEKILNETSRKASQIFQGELTHKNTCSECKTDTNTSDPFWSLPLALESDNNEYNVEKEIKDFFQEVCIDGDNQLYCEICDAKAGAKIKLEMTRYPEVLTLLLKRFRFDHRYQEHVKIKRAVTAPDTLQIPENQTYELYAFVEHFGDLRSGHYTVTIKSQDDDRWYNFNDTCVTLLPERPFQLDRNNTSSSAYLLFYRRKKMHAADTQHISEAPTGGASANEQQEQVVKTTGRDEANKYHGLVNQGGTCYLNSVLQVLFMTKDFREAVTRNPGASQYIDHRLNTLFDKLKENTAYTHEISSKLDINPVSIRGGAAECFEKILSLTSPEASQIFQGVLTHRNKCSTCSTETGTDDPFWTLPLQLVQSDTRDYSVTDAVAKYFSQSDAGGGNQLYCDRCACKSDAAIKLEMRHHPDVLTLLLKKNKFDHQYQVCMKIRQEVIVPKTLQIPENQTYELYAFVEHFGDLRFGHYTVTIKSQDDEDDDRWYNFDDTYVTLLPEGPFQLDRNNTALTRSSSAYLLFYRRKKMHAADTQHISEAPTGGASANEQQEQVVKTTGRDEANKYHGLVNQGATCYLNSVLQVLFMTKEFRKAVTRNPGRSQYIDHPLDTLFDNLKKDTAYTHEISSKLDINSVSVQGDAAECFEKILSLTSPEASQIFQGVLTHRNKCSTCSTETGTDDPFWTLPLQLVQSDIKDYNVAHAIAKYFSQSDASGVNQLYCDQCGCKCDAAIKLEMRHHPDVLTLLLKRFRFDHRYQEHVKIKRAVTAPDTLQIPENQTYELYAFVEHFGDLRSGHYTVTIKSQDDDRWYNFNDTCVTLLPERPFQLDRNNTSSSAYLLFYRRKKMHAADTQHISEAPTGGASANEQQEQVVKTTGRDEGEAAGMDHNLVDIQGKDQQMIMNDVENKDESKQEKEKEKYSAKNKKNKDMEHVDNESSDQITKKRKTDNQESDDHKNDVVHQQNANLKPRKGSDHQDNQHSLTVKQNEEMREYRLRDKDKQMMIAEMVDSNSTDEANRGKTRDVNSGSVVHKDSSDMFQSSGKVDEGKRNMSENDEEQKKNDKQHETDGEAAQRRDKTKRDFCESGKYKYSYLLADDSQSKEQHNLGQKVRHECVEGEIIEKKQKNTGHDGGREWSLSGSNRLTENYRSSTGDEQMKPHSQSELWVTQSHSRPRSVSEDMEGIGSEKEDQTINIQSMNTQTQKMSEDVNDMFSKFKELNLNEPLHFGPKFKNNSEANEHKKKRKGHEQVFSNISETKQEQQKEIIKYGRSRQNTSQIYTYFQTTLTRHDDESSTSKQNGQRSPQLEIHSVEVIGHEEIIKMKLKRDYQQIPGDVDQQQTGDHTGKQNNDEEVKREQTKEISKPYCGESGKD
ncbi:uncharacterized protein LOC102201228 [Pundamilia nyererei]|uniref:Uncharacterized protein LOC102201228 n=1 Tax=Pundamilia nyererei TaxID=303518 RepID=A0A9Y6J8B5_9CICH|nr:PREDICTED: uncharacterized protein LOC102201228 [Pundamilia nyererei]